MASPREKSHRHTPAGHHENISPEYGGPRRGAAPLADHRCTSGVSSGTELSSPVIYRVHNWNSNGFGAESRPVSSPVLGCTLRVGGVHDLSRTSAQSFGKTCAPRPEQSVPYNSCLIQDHLYCPPGLERNRSDTSLSFSTLVLVLIVRPVECC
jgi:hypothetical protein